MSYLSQLLQPLAAAGLNMPVNDERAWTNWAPPTAAGVQVSPDTALKISTVWACVGLISDCLGMLPTIIYERMANGDRRRAGAHPLYALLHDQPNANQTAFDWKKMQTAHLLLRGNAYNYIQPGPRGFADQLKPLPPDWVTPEKLPDDRLRYKYQEPGKPPVWYTDDEIMHLRGLTLDGKIGLGVVAHARETLGTSLAREAYGARFFGNNSRPDGVLKTAGKLSKEGGERMAASWNDAHQGVGKSHRIAILEEGLEYQAMSLSNKDSQFLELGEFTAEDIAGRWFRVPPHMVGLTSKSTSWGSGIEQMGIGFVTYTLMPWLTIWEQSISRDLILATGRYFAEFLTDALLRGDMTSRYNAYSIGRNNGWLSVNEIRTRENMNRIDSPGADEYIKPLNMTDIDDDQSQDQQEMDQAPAGQPMPGMPEDTPPAPAPENGAHYTRLLFEAVHRVARKEYMAMSKAAKRGGDWSAAVTDFYGDHAPYVAQVLAVPIERAETYAAAQALMLLESGPAYLTDFEDNAGGTLLKLAQEHA